MPQAFILTLISPFISQRELEGLFTWVHSQLGPSTQKQVHPLIDPTAGEEALRVDFHFQWSDPDAYDTFRKKFYQALKATPPASPIHAASLVTAESKRATKKLYVFDMDSTFINQEVIDEIGREVGLYDQFSEITESAMQGRIDFIQALHDRVGLLKGLFHERALDILPRLTLSPGIEVLIAAAKKSHTHTMIVSGGFDFVLEHFQKQLGIDTIHAHHLIVDADGLLEGVVQLPIIDGEKKQSLVRTKMSELGVTADEVVIVGDGANDIKMMAEGSTQVAFQGKEKLNQVVNTWILDRHYRWLKALL